MLKKIPYFRGLKKSRVKYFFPAPERKNFRTKMKTLWREIFQILVPLFLRLRFAFSARTSEVGLCSALY